MDQPAPIRIVVIEGPDAGKDLIADRGTLTVGAQEGCDLVLTDGAVSRKHVALELFGSKVRVKDLGSKNGTYFLGNRIDSMELPLGATFTVGQTRVALMPSVSSGTLSAKDELAGLVGRSASMKRLFAQLEQVATTDASVLLMGPTGSGKEAVARSLHALSPRAKGPFVVFDSGAVSKELMQSTLFGHVKGAFTSAVKDSAGALELANGGVLFLDEVAQLPLELQPLLLRALETKTFSRVGDTKPMKSDFRVIASTQHDLQTLARQGTFRMDVYYRLAALVLQVPPLAERLEDIPLLAHRFAADAKATDPLSPSTIATLCAKAWPGNARELKNAVERIVTLGPDAVLPKVDGQGPKDFHQSREQALRAFERGYLQALLERHGGNASAAAREAGIARSYLYRMLDAHGLKK